MSSKFGPEAVEKAPHLEQGAPELAKYSGDTGTSSGEFGEFGEFAEQEDGWDEPILFGQIETDEIPSNVLPTWLREFAEALSKSTQTPVGMSVMLILSALATCLQKRAEISPYPGYKEPLSLWTVTVLPPASRKTQVINAVMAPIREWERDQAARLQPEIDLAEDSRSVIVKRMESLKADAAKADDKVEREAKIKEVQQLRESLPDEKKVPRLWTSDVTPEKLQDMLAENGERMSVIADEGGIFEVMGGLYSDGKANIDVFLQAHSGSPVRVDRLKRAAVQLSKPALSFGLTVQPAIIADMNQGGKRKFRGNGALARFLYCVPKSNVGKRDVSKHELMPDAVQSRYENEIVKLLNWSNEIEGEEQGTLLLGLTPGAHEVWMDFFQWIEQHQGEGCQFETIQDWTGKLHGQCLRIAALCHIAQHGKKSTEIDLMTMGRARDLCTVLISHAQAALDLMGSDPVIEDAKFVAKWIADKGCDAFRQNELHRLGRFNKTKVDRLNKALAVLFQRHIIGSPRKERSEKGTKPMILFSVNPAFLGK